MNAPNPMLVHLDHNFYTAMLRASAFMPAAVKNMLVLVKFFFEELLHWLTAPVEVLLRREFGLRALSLYAVVQLWGATVIFVIFGHGLSINPLLALFLLGSSGLAAYHFIEARRYERSGKPWRHTYTNGTPHRFWANLAPALSKVGVDPRKCLTIDNVMRFGEPLLCLVIGLIGLVLSKSLGYFLIASAAALMLKAHLRHVRYIDAMRDKHDASAIGLILAGNGTVGERVVFVVRSAEFRTEPRMLVPTASSNGTPEAEPPASTVSLRCDNCGRRLKVKEKHLGRVFPCPECGEPVKVETASAA